jgi:hypothetical protein
LYGNTNKNVEQNETFRLVSNLNTITHVTVKETCTLNKIQLLITLFKRLRHLAISTNAHYLKRITRFLLNATYHNAQSLSSVSFLRATDSCQSTVCGLIRSETEPDDCMVKTVNSIVHLWL